MSRGNSRHGGDQKKGQKNKRGKIAGKRGREETIVAASSKKRKGRGRGEKRAPGRGSPK